MEEEVWYFFMGLPSCLRSDCLRSAGPFKYNNERSRRGKSRMDHWDNFFLFCISWVGISNIHLFAVLLTYPSIFKFDTLQPRYLTGEYLPIVPKKIRGTIIMWNPFIKEPFFMLKLQRAVEEFKETGGNGRCCCCNFLRYSCSKMYPRVSAQGLRLDGASVDAQTLVDAAAADAMLDNPFLRFARRRPKDYIRIVGHLFAFSEIIAMMTPTVAMGIQVFDFRIHPFPRFHRSRTIQWATALCDGPPVLAIIDLLWAFFSCIFSSEKNCDALTLNAGNMTHCILR